MEYVCFTYKLGDDLSRYRKPLPLHLSLSSELLLELFERRMVKLLTKYAVILIKYSNLLSF